MSSIKLQSVQYGNSSTVANNFVLTTPASPNGTITLHRGVLGNLGASIFSISAANKFNLTDSLDITGTGNVTLDLKAGTAGSQGRINFHAGNVWRTSVTNHPTTHDFSVERFGPTGAFVGSMIRGQNSTGNLYFNEGGGHIYTNGEMNASVFRANPVNGLQFNSYHNNGSGGFSCTIAYGNPNFANFHQTFYHQSGSWVGWQITSSTNTLRWSGQSGVLNADAFTVWSDRRLKTDLQKIESAREKISKLAGYEYTLINSYNYDGTRKIKAGLIAQDVLNVLPSAVELVDDGRISVGPEQLTDDETPGQKYSLDYNAIIALLVNDNNALAARIEALEDVITKLQSGEPQ